MTELENHLQRTTNRALKNGHDLIKVSMHANPCPKCALWQGKILSITGKTPGYPTLEKAKAAGLFHNQCRHAISVYIDLDKEIEQLEAELEEKPPAAKAKNSTSCGCGTLVAILSMVAFIAVLLFLL